MAVRLKAWLWVLIIFVSVGILCVVAVAGVGFYFFSRHFDTQAVSVEDAQGQFERVRKQFAGQKPLVELDPDGRFLRSNPGRSGGRPTRKPDQITVLVFEPNDRRIVKVSIPFWLLRFQPRGATVDFNGGRMDLEDLKLTVEDLERFGPTLIVDHLSPDGERVLVWSQ